jgi:hypothetical protein
MRSLTGARFGQCSTPFGHANAATTLNLYSHLWPGDEDRIRQAVDRALADPAEDWLRTAGTED